MIEIQTSLATGMLEKESSVDSLSADVMWRSHGPTLWSSMRFDDTPEFYPVYRERDHYSFSPLALIVRKGSLRLDARFLEQVRRPHFMYASGLRTIDTEVCRIGGPAAASARIFDPDDYAQRVADALVSDTTRAEADNPGLSNFVLCGGRDSLNLLLLPWGNPTFAVSAPPNFQLVRKFVEANHLDIPVLPLPDARDDGVLRREILENACRMNLEHCRWGADLCDIATRNEHQVVFWKGQVADVFLTPKWKVLTHPMRGGRSIASKVYARGEPLLPRCVKRGIGRQLLEPYFRDVLWKRCAMWQGAHMSLIRAITGCLVLSAYHGPTVSRVFREVDLSRAAVTDIRPRVGRILLGRDVVYPSTNPGPPSSQFRAGLSTPEKFLDLLAELRIPVEFDPSPS